MDIEEYTHNQLEVAKIKQLKLIGKALESIAASAERLCRGQIVSEAVDVRGIDFKLGMINRQVVEADENPDANVTDLGLTDEEKLEIEAKEKEDKFWKGEELRPKNKGKKK